MSRRRRLGPGRIVSFQLNGRSFVATIKSILFDESLSGSDGHQHELAIFETQKGAVLCRARTYLPGNGSPMTEWIVAQDLAALARQLDSNNELHLSALREFDMRPGAEEV